MRCRCGKREAWRVAVRLGNYSWFSGGSAGRRTPSDYSELVCARHAGGCGARWRTKARYVAGTPDGEDCYRCGGRKTTEEEIPDANSPVGFRLRTIDCPGCAGTGQGRPR